MHQKRVLPPNANGINSLSFGRSVGLNLKAKVEFEHAAIISHGQR